MQTFPFARLTSINVSPYIQYISVVQESFTCCPSTTPFGLALGPDLPWADEPSPGTLRFSAAKILTLLSLLIPAFSLLYCPPFLSVWLHPVQNAPLPLYNIVAQSKASVYSLAPVIFGAGLHRPVSYYALFKWMAASKPTSWLSVNSHILFHLTIILGP